METPDGWDVTPRWENATHGSRGPASDATGMPYNPTWIDRESFVHDAGMGGRSGEPPIPRPAPLAGPPALMEDLIHGSLAPTHHPGNSGQSRRRKRSVADGIVPPAAFRSQVPRK